MMLESIKKLRMLWKKLPAPTRPDELLLADVNSGISEIERELAERYMLLPVDSEGVPIRVGDFIKGAEELDPVVKVTGVAQNEFHGPMVQTDDAITGRWYCVAPGTVHVKTYTIEDVLTEFSERVCRSGHQWGLDAPTVVPEYAAKLRELLKGEE